MPVRQALQAGTFTFHGLPCSQGLGYVRLVQEDIEGWNIMHAGICLTSLLSTLSTCDLVAWQELQNPAAAHHLAYPP